jgi:hypothetical protein
MRSPTLSLCLLAAACGSAPVPDGPPAEDERPSAPPIVRDRLDTPPAAPDAGPDPNSPSRVMGYVEGDVVTFREVQQSIGPQLAQMESAEERDRMVDRALLDIVRDKMLYRAAVDAGVKVSRDELDREREKFVRELAKSGGTLDAYLHERSMSRRESEERAKREIVVDKFHLASIGQGRDPNVHVRPTTDIFVSPYEVRAYYDRHPERYHEPATARCRVLAVKTDLEAPDREAAVAAAKARAEAIVARLRAGEDWVPVYREATQGAGEPEPDDGLLELRRGQKAKWLEDYAFDSPKGTLGDPHQVGTTFYVRRAEGAHEERTVPFDEASQRIREYLLQIKAQLAWLEVELTVLDQSSIQPDALRVRLREWLRQMRLKLLQDAGL